MNAENTKYLLEKYPKLFRQARLSPRETCMCWLFEFGDGWFLLVDKLCYKLQWDIDKNHYPQIEFTQTKEKFGALRLYYDGGNDQQLGAINFAEYLSGFICEECGSMENVTQTEGWIYTRCKKCHDAMKYPEKKGKFMTVLQLMFGEGYK